jgi:hypothetical protein
LADPIVRRRDAADRLIDVRRRVRNLETQNWSIFGHKFNAQREPNPVAEWLAYYSNISPAEYVPSQAAWSLIAAERSGGPEVWRRTRTIRENLGIIPRMASALDGVNMGGVAATTISGPGGAIIGNYASPTQPSMRHYVWDGMWCWPIVRPGRPRYHFAEWLGGTDHGRWEGVDARGVGLSVVSDIGPDAAAMLRFEYHPAGDWTPPGGTPFMLPVVVLKDVRNDNPVSEFGWGRGAAQFFEFQDTNGDLVGDTWVLVGETAADYDQVAASFVPIEWGAGNGLMPPQVSYRTVVSPARDGGEFTPEAYSETSFGYQAATFYVLADGLRAWGPPITLPEARRLHASVFGDAGVEFSLLSPDDPEWSGPPSYESISGSSIVLGTDLDAFVAGALSDSYDQQGWVALTGDTSAASGMARAWAIYRYGLVHLRGFIDRSHFGSSVILDLPSGIQPPDGTTFVVPAVGSTSTKVVVAETTGSSHYLNVLGMAEGDRAYLDGIMWAP